MHRTPGPHPCPPNLTHPLAQTCLSCPNCVTPQCNSCTPFLNRQLCPPKPCRPTDSKPLHVYFSIPLAVGLWVLVCCTERWTEGLSQLCGGWGYFSRWFGWRGPVWAGGGGWIWPRLFLCWRAQWDHESSKKCAPPAAIIIRRGLLNTFE